MIKSADFTWHLDAGVNLDPKVVVPHFETSHFETNSQLKTHSQLDFDFRVRLSEQVECCVAFFYFQKLNNQPITNFGTFLHYQSPYNEHFRSRSYTNPDKGLNRLQTATNCCAVSGESCKESRSVLRTEIMSSANIRGVIYSDVDNNLVTRPLEPPGETRYRVNIIDILAGE